MYKKIFIILISLVISIFIIGCSGGTTSRTTNTSNTTSTTSSTSTTSTNTEQTGTATQGLIVGTTLEANTTLTDYLADLAQSESAKRILADFYTYFLNTETYIWADSTMTEVESYTQIWADFDTWEIAYFVAAKNWDLFPDLFNGIFTFEQEVVHPASDGNTAIYSYTMALRWNIDPRSGEVTAANQNA